MITPLRFTKFIIYPEFHWIGLRPHWYVFHCDKIQTITHFRFKIGYSTKQSWGKHVARELL